VTPTAPATRQYRHRHSPRVRRLAHNLGVPLDQVAGTGPAGRVRPDDVHRAATAIDSAGTVESRPVPAQLTTVVEADVTSLASLIRDPSQRTAVFARAAVEALRNYPQLNATLAADGASVVPHAAANLGITVDTDRGVAVPVVSNAGDLTLLALARVIDDLMERARSARIAPADLTGGTFTLADTGSSGALFDTPLLVPGQVGALGVGAVVERPVVVTTAEGERSIAIRSMVYVSLSYDHRFVGGADAARYLGFLVERLHARHFSSDLG
jgi:pyruvate dehydrogenase E2 component (dihydrolipoamide acetyltransferase)